MMFSVLFKLLAVGQLWASVVRWLKEEKKKKLIRYFTTLITSCLFTFTENQFDINKAWNPRYFQHGEEVEMGFHS